MTFRYVITGDHHMAHPIHSNLNYLEMEDYVRRHTKCNEYSLPVFRIGVLQFYNPIVYMVDDWANLLPLLIEK